MASIVWHKVSKHNPLELHIFALEYQEQQNGKFKGDGVK